MQDVKSLFDELNPRLEAARKLDREMNRVFAHRFNILDYLRTNELGLSCIIADLLNPSASHGQGTFFLETFLRRLEKEKAISIDSQWFGFHANRIQVETEYTIEYRRRIDIYVLIPGRNKEEYCLAIENKPYTDDESHQIADYLKYLNQKYRDKFLLIYLSSRGQFPSDLSLPKNEYNAWKSRFKVMAYHPKLDLTYTENRESRSEICKERTVISEVNDTESSFELDQYRISFSLTDWLSESRKNCDVDRLRSFLRDTAEFCKYRIGGESMKNSSEIEALKEVLFSDENNLKTAKLIYEEFPILVNDVYERFLNKLCTRIEQQICQRKLFKSLEYVEINKTHKNTWNGYSLWITSRNWKEYEISGNDKSNAVDSRIGVWMQTESMGCSGWIIGVAYPADKTEFSQSNGDRDRCDRLEKCLRESSELVDYTNKEATKWWPCSKDVKSKYQNWSDLIVSLYEECESNNKDNEITEYFVNEMLGLAENAIPIIDKIEGDGG